MSEAATALGFFDPARRLSGSVRTGLGVVFEGEGHRVTDEPPEMTMDRRGWSVALGERSRLRFEALGPQVDLGGTRTHLCRVDGRLDDRRVDCLGAATEIVAPPDWSELDATRSIVAVFGKGDALVAFARRPRGAVAHGQERIEAALYDRGEARQAEEARLSTVYDGEGRQRTASLELWLPSEEFPRRASGVCTAGMSLALEGVDVHLGVFDWRMEGRAGAGAYELTVRVPEREAAA